MERDELFFEDVVEGGDIPALTKHPTTRQLVMWAGASRDFIEIHYDKDVAQARGLPAVVVHGALKSAFLAQLLTDWIGPRGWLKELNCRYEGMDLTGEDLVCRGKVIRKYMENDENLVTCKVWTTGAAGKETVLGSATVALPSRSG